MKKKTNLMFNDDVIEIRKNEFDKKYGFMIQHDLTSEKSYNQVKEYYANKLKD